MTSRMTKTRPSRNNTSRKKAKRTLYSETMNIATPLLKSFVGFNAPDQPDTLSQLLNGYKAKLDFSLSNEGNVVLTVTTKHRNHLDVIMGRLVDRYNKLVTVANNLIDARAQDD